MALPESAFRTPYWIKIEYNTNEKFDYMEYQYNNQPNRHWRVRPRPGFNAQSPSISVDVVNLATDVPYIRAR